MDWNILFTIVITILQVQRSSGQDWTRLANFTCNDDTKGSRELVIRTGETGTVSSPCYFVDGRVYPEEQTSGLKLVLINFTSPYLHGYRLTVRDFDLASTDRLYIGDSTEEFGGFLRALRQLQLLNSSVEGQITLQEGEDGAIIKTFTVDANNAVDLEGFGVVFLDFYTVVDSLRGRGFLIDYAADINRCLFEGSDVYCKNNGICSRTGFNTASCDCTDTGYEGTICTADINECTRGTDDCHPNADCANNDGSFTCTCKVGYTGSGKVCEDINECTTGVHVCAETGTCLNTDGSYTCDCNVGYENGTEPPCENINECERGTDTCSADATCEDTAGSFTCTCGEFFTGNGTICTDIDECTVRTAPCGTTGTCDNKVGGFDCICFDGYTGGTGGPCTDIDECGDGTDDCDIDTEADCTNTIGSYTCACKTGFNGNGTHCEDINECAANTDDCHDTRATCENEPGSFSCRCNSGYSGDGKTCDNIDECAESTDDCDDDADCTDTDGSFTCQCRTGFTGDGKICADNDECTRDEDNNCDSNAECKNSPGTFSCVCNAGFTGTGTTGNCRDIDECSLDGSCDDNAGCENLPGTFKCTCNSGFTGNGTTCDDEDECTLGTDNCDSVAACTNIPGSFTCKCEPGYTGTGVTCADINECGSTDNCNDTTGVCTNTNGSFTCSCKEGYRGDGINCTNIDECAEGSDTCVDAESTCRDTVGGFECICIEPTYRGSPGSCDYYCQFNTSCIVDRQGFIENPEYNDGTKTYEEFAETFWNFQASTTGAGIRFTFVRFSTERRDDFLSIYPGTTANFSLEIVGISGAIGDLYNEEFRVTTSGYIQRPGSAVTAYLDLSDASRPTLTLSSSELYIGFTSDRFNVSTGFLLGYEYDKNDCPAVDPCKNGGTCQDLPFDYTCRGCTGFKEEKNCDTDIDECTEGTFPCHPNATCTNTVGSYSCACNEDFTGNGTACVPLIVLSNFRADRTTTSLSVNFDITSTWRNPEYIVTFEITISRVIPTDIRTFTVNLTQLLTDDLLITGLETYTEYEITVAVVVFGPGYGSSVLQNDIASQKIFTSESNAGTPTDFTVSLTTRNRVSLTWVKPAERGFGRVLRYEICYSFATDTTTQQVVSLRSPTQPADKCFIIDDTFTTFSFTDLPSYFNINFKMRAYSPVGPSDFTTEQTVYISSIVCAQWVDFASRAPCAIDTSKGLQGVLISDGFPREKTNSDNEIIQQEWSFDTTSYAGWRANFVFFDIFPQESTLDYGYGNEINPREHDLEKEAQAGSFTAILSGFGDVQVKNTSDPDENTLWMTYISDRTRKSTGFQVEIQLDGNDCFSTPCLSGGSCTDGSFTYTCDCSATDYTGTNCEFPHVKPTVTCNPDKRSAGYSFNVQDLWRNDETVIGGYTIELSLGGSVVETTSRALGEAMSGTFSGMTPFTNYTIKVTVSSSTRDGAVYNVAETPDGGCETLEAAPTAPQLVSITPAVKSLIVTWQAPAEPNGNVVYIVSHVSTDHETYGESLQSGSSGSLTDTSYTITGLRDYRTYNVTVRGQTGGGSTDTAPESSRTSPGAPPAFISGTVTVLPRKSARVEWALESSNIGPITVTISAKSDIHDLGPVTVPSTPTSYELMNLEEDQTYNFTLTASTGTAPDQTIMVFNINTDASAPLMPATFTFDRDSATFRWSAPAPLDRNGVITGYRLTAVAGDPGFTTQDFNATVFSYVLTGVPAFTKYSFTLQAQNSEGVGLPFALDITTREEVPEPVPNITLDEATATTLTISWPVQIPAVGETTYVVSYTDGTTSFGPDTTADNSSTLTGLRPFTTYMIEVVAETNAGAASPTQRSFQTAESTPSAPQNLVVTFTPYIITVTWAAPEQPNGVITQYNVRAVANGVIVADLRLHPTVTSREIQSITLSETTYAIEVSASTSVGEGVVSKQNVTTPVLLLNAPRNPFVSDITNTTVVVNADAPDNADSLEVDNYIITISQNADDCTKYDETCLSNDKSNTPGDLPATISGLKPFRVYELSIAGRSAGGIGTSSSVVTFTTEIGVPNQPNVTSITTVPGGLLVVFDAGTPYTGPADYNITVTDGNEINIVLTNVTNLTSISATVPNLAGGTNYQVSVTASNSAGSSAPTSPQSIMTSPAAPNVTLARTSNSSLTVTITPVTGATRYSISHVQSNCENCTAMTVETDETTYVITGLMVNTEYSVLVFAISAAGAGSSSSLSQRTRVGQPTLIDENYVLQQSDQSEPTLRTSYNALLENLCLVRSTIFNQATGVILRVAYISRQQGSEGPVNLNTFYGQVHAQNPSPAFVSLFVECDTGTTRKKRTVTENGVIVGADNTCPGGGTTVCNGPLKPGTTYTFQACGVNEDGLYVCTDESNEITTDPAPGLTAGEIAAIVICSVLLVILIILLIVYIVKRRRHTTGKHSVSRRGADNPSFESKASQQKYQVDPTAEAQTDYTVPSA